MLILKSHGPCTSDGQAFAKVGPHRKNPPEGGTMCLVPMNLSRVGLVQALAQLAEVMLGDAGGLHVLDAVVCFVGQQGDHAFFAQRLQAPVGSGGRHVGGHAHGLQHRDLLAAVPDRGKQVEQALFDGVQYRKVRQSADTLNQIQESQIG